jgi:hypothetical protein
MTTPGVNCRQRAARRRSAFAGGRAKPQPAVCRCLAAPAAEPARPIEPVDCRRPVAPVSCCRWLVELAGCCRLRGAAQMSLTMRQPPGALDVSRSRPAPADYSRLAARAGRRSPVAQSARYCPRSL